MLIYEVLDMLVNDQDDPNYYTKLDPPSPLYRERQALGEREGYDTSNFAATALWGTRLHLTIQGDSLYTWFWSCLSSLDRKRHATVAFPKSRICACGCYGRHTFDLVWLVIVWMSWQLMSGVCGEFRHVEVALRVFRYPTDKAQAKRQGKQFQRGCCIFLFLFF